MTMSFSIGAGRTILRTTATDSTDGADFSFADALAADTSYLIQASLSISHFSQTTEPPTIPTAGAGHAPAQGMAFDGVTLGYADYVQPTGISTPSLSQGTMLNNYIIDGAPFDGDPADANGRFDIVIRYSGDAAYAPYLTQQFDFSYYQRIIGRK
jgi:hypothetical protein